MVMVCDMRDVVLMGVVKTSLHRIFQGYCLVKSGSQSRELE